MLLLAVGMTRAELDQLQASSIGASIALNYLGAASGADKAVKQALPIIDDFRFGSAYSTITGKTEPQLTVGKRLTNDLRASVTAGLSEDRELRSNIEWRLNNRLSVQGSYDNINDVSSSALGQPRSGPSLEARVRVAVVLQRMRALGSALLLALGLWPGLAHAQTVTPIPAPPAPPTAPLVPTIDPAPIYRR